MITAPIIGLYLIVLLVAITFLGLLIWGAIALFRHGGPVMRVFVVLAGVILLLIPSVVVLNFVAMQRTSEGARVMAASDWREVHPQLSSTPLSQTSQTANPAATWNPAAEILPDATVDFYPSQREAERAVAAAIAEAYNPSTRVAEGFMDLQPLVLTHAMDGPSTDEYQGVADALRRLGVTSRAVKPGISNHTHQHGIRLELTPPDASTPIGTYRARDDRLENPVSFAFSARFVDKPWLTDLPAFRIVSESPDLVVGFTAAPESTEANAEDAALRAVAARLARHIADERSPNHNYDPSIMYPQLESIARNLRRFGLIEDQFTQKLQRSYGTVFRHAVLVDATPDTIKRIYNGGNLTWVDRTPEQQLAQKPPSHAAAIQSLPSEYADASVTVTDGGHGEWQVESYAVIILRVLGLGVLVAVTLLIYRVLDHWTLGYRQGALTVTAVAVVLGGAALLGLLLVS